jgi:hypothetical protein
MIAGIDYNQSQEGMSASFYRDKALHEIAYTFALDDRVPASP